MLSPAGHTANEQDIPVPKQPDSPHSCTESNPMNPPKPPANGTYESLGHKLIAGVDAIGSRQDTYSSSEAKAAGASPIGTFERWCSPELELGMDFHERDDMDGREITQTIISIETGDPDPSLFDIPSDYSVVRTRANTISNAARTGAAK
jgi:hypothetical protein